MCTDIKKQYDDVNEESMRPHAFKFFHEYLDVLRSGDMDALENAEFFLEVVTSVKTPKLLLAMKMYHTEPSG